MYCLRHMRCAKALGVGIWLLLVQSFRFMVPGCQVFDKNQNIEQTQETKSYLWYIFHFAIKVITIFARTTWLLPNIQATLVAKWNHMIRRDFSLRSMPNDSGLRPGRRRSVPDGSGFTLLEMLISLTMLSLVVLTVYMTFSLGVDVWQRMEEEESAERRQALAVRLLQEDFAQIRPYTWAGDEGQVRFFAGGPQSVFYVTTNGLGSRERQGKALFFTCLFVRSEDEALALHIYKTALPRPDLLEAVQDFRASGDTQRENYEPPSFVRENSVLVLSNLQEAGFAYQDQAYPVFSGVKVDIEGDWSQEMDSQVLAETEWVGDNLPGQISFQAQGPLGELLARTVLAQQPVLNRSRSP